MIGYLAGLLPFVFYGTIVLVAVAELLLPDRPTLRPVSSRWITNITLFSFQFSLQYLLLPLSALIAAASAEQAGAGLLPALGLPATVAVIAGVVLLDLWKYWEHRLIHAIPLLWRLHRVHHTDVEIDFTSSERHHPLELALGIVALFPVVYALGVPPLAVVIYSLVAALVVVASHANIRVAQPVDRALRSLVVTPAFHLIHHSAEKRETNSNYGLILTVWDRIFGSLCVPDRTGDERRILGIEEFRDPCDNRIDRVLLQPWLSPTVTHAGTLGGAGDRTQHS